jgi:hypothetical protein
VRLRQVLIRVNDCMAAEVPCTAERIDRKPGRCWSPTPMASRNGRADARAARDEPWGDQALLRCLQEREGQRASAAGWRDEPVAAVPAPMGAADRCDDLTVLVLRLRARSRCGPSGPWSGEQCKAGRSPPGLNRP